jgi:hypothetical protein
MAMSRAGTLVCGTFASERSDHESPRFADADIRHGDLVAKNIIAALRGEPPQNSTVFVSATAATV